MKSGSLVVMEKDFNNSEIEFLSKKGITLFPIKSGGPYIVGELSNWKDLKGSEKKYGDWLSLEEFPDAKNKGVYFNVDLFREIQSPDEINVGEIIEDALFVKI